MGTDMARVGREMSMKVTLPIIAIGAGLFKMASDAIESENLVREAMGDMEGDLRRISEGIRRDLGLNDYEFRKQASTIYLMTSAMGVQKQAAFEMSTQLTMLAYDLASFRNMRFEEAFEKITAGLTGEMEPLKRIGILVSENATRQALFNAGLIRGKEVLTDQQKVMGRYLAIMQQTAKDQGDLARTLVSPTNQFRLLTSQVKLAAIELGMELMPAYKELLDVGKQVIGWVKEAVVWFANLSEGKKRLIVQTALLAAAIGPLLSVLGNLVRVLGLSAAAMAFGPKAVVAGALLLSEVLVNLRLVAMGAAEGVGILNLANMLLSGTILAKAVPNLVAYAAIIAAAGAAYVVFEAAMRKAEREIEDATDAQIVAIEALRGKVAATGRDAQGAGDAIGDAFREAAPPILAAGKSIAEIAAEMSASLAVAENLRDVLGPAYELTAEQVSITRKAIEELVEAGADLNTVLDTSGYTLGQLLTWYRRLEGQIQAVTEAERQAATVSEYAREVIESLQTPMDRYNTALAQARIALAAGLIDEAQFAANAARLRDELAKATAPLATDAQRAGEDISRALVGGILDKDVWASLKRALRYIVETHIVKVFTAALGIASPSRVAMGWGRAVAEGYALGLAGMGGSTLGLVGPPYRYSLAGAAPPGTPAPAPVGFGAAPATSPVTNITIHQHLGFGTQGETDRAGWAAHRAQEGVRYV